MNCSQVRDRLIRGDADERVERHVRECAACGTFAVRTEAALAGLHDHDAGAVPGAGFAARVIAALPDSPHLLAWAALRLLPATAALALALTGWCLTGVPGPAELVGGESATDDPLTWLLEVEDGEETS